MFQDNFEQAGEDTNSPSALDVRNILYIVLEKLWLIAICMAAAAMIAAFYLLRAPAIYAATAVIKFETEQKKILDVEEVLQQDYQSDQARKEKFREIEQMLRNRALLARVIETNNLASDPRFMPQGAAATTDTRVLARRLAGMIRAELRSDSRLIAITVEHRDPQLVALLANSVVQELVRRNTEFYKTTSHDATSFLSGEAQKLQAKIKEAEKMLQAKDQTLSLEQRQAVVTANLADLNGKRNQARAERLRLEMQCVPVQQMGTNVNGLLALPVIANDPAVAAVRSRIAEAEVDHVNLKQVYKEKHPVYIQAQTRLDKLREVLLAEATEAARTLLKSYESAVATEQAMERELQKQEAIAQGLNAEFISHNVLRRDIEQYRALYDSVVKRMGETNIAGELDNRRIQLLQSADVPIAPVRPNKPRVLLLGLLAGLGVAVVVALGIGIFDDSLRTLAETEQVLRIPVLATIPKIPGAQAGQMQIMIDSEARSPGAESFRYLRTSLVRVGDSKPKSFLFTSTLPEEGKTFCSVNYAISLAQQGLRTVLIDCDLRRPMAARILLDDPKSNPGVTDYLLEKHTLPEIIHANKIDNLFFIPAGKPVSNPSELLGQERIQVLLDEALRNFDRVVIDSAPLFGVTDTLLLVSHAQAVCLVVRAHRTSRKAVLRSIQVLHGARAPLAGVVLNAVPRSRRSAYGNPYYDYGYYPKEPAEAAETV